jgi:single-stranded DNA-binding protein
MDMNIASFTGRLAAAVEYRPGKDGKAGRATARLIVNRPKLGDGDQRYDTIPVVGWGPHAETLKNYTHKGKEISVRGEIHTHSTRNDDGSYNNYWELSVERISLGRDSNQVKAQKALGAVAEQTDAAALRALLSNPANKKKLLDAVSKAVPTEVSKEEELRIFGGTEVPTIDVEIPAAAIKQPTYEVEVEDGELSQVAENPFADNQ